MSEVVGQRLQSDDERIVPSEMSVSVAAEESVEGAVALAGLLAAKVASCYRRKRLLFFLMLQFALGASIHAYLNWSAPSLPILGLLLAEGIGAGLGVFLGIYAILDIRSRIVRNIFYERPHSIWHRVAVLVVFVAWVSMLTAFEFSDVVFHLYLANPMTAPYPVAVLCCIVWLLDYERTNGPVYVAR